MRKLLDTLKEDLEHTADRLEKLKLEKERAAELSNMEHQLYQLGAR